MSIISNGISIKSIFSQGTALGRIFSLGKLVWQKLQPDNVYLELEYCEADGRQWVDTGIFGDETTELGLEFSLTSLIQQKIAGSREAYNLNNLTLAYPTNGATNYFNIDFQSSDINRLTTSFPFVVGQFYTAISSPDALKLDNTVKAVSNVTPFTTPTTLRIFDGYGLTYASNMMRGRVKHYWIKKNDSYIKDCIPVKMLKDAGGGKKGEVGFWDLRSNTFYGSATNVPLIAGPIKTLPYVELEYCQSNGNSYIDTGYILQYTSGKSRLKTQVVNKDGQGTQGLFGFIERSGNLVNRVSVGFTTWGQYFVGSGNTLYFTSEITTDPVEITWDRKNETAMMNDIEIAAVPFLRDGPTYSSYLFTRNNKNKPDAPYDCTQRISRYTEYDDSGNAQLDFIPVRMISNAGGGQVGDIGMWDLVNEKFYGSETSTEFIPGPIKIQATQTRLPIMDGLIHWWDAENQVGNTWIPKVGDIVIDTADSWENGYYKKTPSNVCETGLFDVDFTNGFSVDICYNLLQFTETDLNSNFDTQLWAINNQDDLEYVLHYTRRALGDVLSYYSPTLLENNAYYTDYTPSLNKFSSDVATYNGETTFKSYVNKNLKLENTVVNDIPTSIKFALNRIKPVNNNQSSLVKSIRIYNRELTAEEIQHNAEYDEYLLNNPVYPDWVFEFGTPLKAVKATEGAYYISNAVAARETALDSKFRWKVEYNAVANRAYEISGIGGSSQNTTYYIGRTKSQLIVYGNFDNNIVLSGKTLNQDIPYDMVVDYKNKKVFLDSLVAGDITLASAVPTFNGNATKLPIGTYKSTAEAVPTTNTFEHTTYAVQQWINNVMTVNEIPFKLTDGTVCMLDLINGDIKTNAGLGAFVGINPDYPAWVYELGTPLYALKSDGNCYIDLGQAVESLDETWEYTYSRNAVGNSVVLGSEGGPSTNCLPGSIYSTNSQFYLGTGAYKITLNTPLNELTHVKIQLTADKKYILYIDDINKGEGTFTSNLNLRNVCAFASSGHSTPIYNGSFTITSVKRSKTSTGEILNNWISFKNIKNELGFLDLVTRDNPTKIGSGNLTPITEDAITQTLLDLGVIPLPTIEEQIRQLKELGVSL